MRKHIKNILSFIIILVTTFSFSQKRENDTIKTGVIDVVKPYIPSVADAFKIKEVPTMDEAVSNSKKTIKYNIFSFPVASTFVPAKGKAEGVEKESYTVPYNNYATLGLGSYTNVLAEVYLNYAISRKESLGGHISHHSSAGGIKNLSFDDNFSKLNANVNYQARLRDLEWNVEGGFNRQMYNWYGVPQSLITLAVDNDIDVSHVFSDFHIAGNVTFEDTYVKKGSLLFRRFGDNQGSGENRLRLKGIADFPIDRENISTEFKIDYLGGSFDRAYQINSELAYQNFQIGLSPTYQLKQDDLSVNLGISTYYLNNTEAGDSKFYIYPNITASYKLVSDVLIVHGGIQGDLIQNSYQEFANENNFVSPTLLIAPTDQQYNTYVGLKGKISNSMSYNICGSYIAERNKALFRKNQITLTEQDYSYGNSFEVVYDDISTFGFLGEINADVNRNLKMLFKAEYYSYSMQDEAEAWNLPNIKGSAFLDYQINEHWFSGVNLFFIGTRKDQFYLNDGITVTVPSTVKLDSYFDANAHVGYHFTDQISAFFKVNNIANNGYQQWLSFPVQSIQFLGGLSYKFDF